MKRFFSLFLKFLLPAVLASILLFFLAFSENWHFETKDPDGDGLKNPGPFSANFAQGKIPEDSKEIFGVNMSEILIDNAAQYLAVKNPDGLVNVSATSVTDLDRYLVQKMTTEQVYARANSELRIYQKSEIQPAPDNYSATVAYLESMKKIMDNYLKEFNGRNLKEVGMQAGVGSEESRQLIVRYIDRTTLALGEMLVLSVPLSWTQDHLALMNAFSETRYFALNFMLNQSDPVRGAFAYNNYDEMAFRFLEAKKSFESHVASFVKASQSL